MAAALGRDAVSDYRRFMREAKEHDQRAQWEEVAKCLEEAKDRCDQEGFPDRTRCKQEVYRQYGGLERRYGRFLNAAVVLERGLTLDEDDENESFQDLISSASQERTSILENEEDIMRSNNLERIDILGELGTVYRHLDDMTNAGRAFDYQYRLSDGLARQMEEQACRAVGNVGMVKYQRAKLDMTSADNQSLLEEAIRDFKARVERSRALKSRPQGLLDPQEASALQKKALQWEAIGIVRLVLCFIEKNDVDKALEHGELGIEVCKDLPDPTSRAHARFYYGYALWKAGKNQEARDMFEFQGSDDRDKCTPAMAFCKEPSAEYRGYLELIIHAGARMHHDDEQGYSALDYAVFSGNEQTELIVIRGLNASAEAGDMFSSSSVSDLRYQAHLRKLYRTILQEHFRPAFSYNLDDPIGQAREKYAQLLGNNSAMTTQLDRLKFVKYKTFRAHHRLPRFDDRDVVTEYQSHDDGTAEHPVVVFISYRWIGASSTPPLAGPDDQSNTQYLRMIDAMEKLKRSRRLREDDLALWLVSAVYVRS